MSCLSAAVLSKQELMLPISEGIERAHSERDLYDLPEAQALGADHPLRRAIRAMTAAQRKRMPGRWSPALSALPRADQGQRVEMCSAPRRRFCWWVPVTLVLVLLGINECIRLARGQEGRERVQKLSALQREVNQRQFTVQELGQRLEALGLARDPQGDDLVRPDEVRYLSYIRPNQTTWFEDGISYWLDISSRDHHVLADIVVQRGEVKRLRVRLWYQLKRVDYFDGVPVQYGTAESDKWLEEERQALQGNPSP